VISIVAWTAGCGDQPPPRAASAEQEKVAPMSCEAGWTYNEDKRYFKGNWREEAVIAGPLTLLQLNTLHDADLSRPRAFRIKVLLEPRSTTTVTVAPEDRDWVRLATQPPNDPYANAGGDPAIRFEGCEPRVDDTRDDELRGTGYAIAVMVDSPGEATLEITPEGAATIRRRVSFGAG
jgi:hypothetical protein